MKSPDSFPDMRCWRLLEAVFTQGSLAAAAERLNVDLSAASRLMQRLEQYAGEPLLNRRRRPASPTPAAGRLRASVQALLQAAERIDGDISALRGPKPARLVRLSIPSNFSDGAKLCAIHAYAEAHPEITFELFSYRDEFDVAEGLLDAAYVPYWPQLLPGIETIPVFRSGTFLLAAPSYLERCGAPQRIEELCGHRLLRRTGRGYPAARFLFKDDLAFDIETGRLTRLGRTDCRTPASLPRARFGPFESGVRILSGDAVSCYQSALAAEGIAVDLSLRLVNADLEAGRLVAVLPPWRPALWTNTLAVRSETAGVPEFKAFAQWFVRKESLAGRARWKRWLSVFDEGAAAASRSGCTNPRPGDPDIL